MSIGYNKIKVDVDLDAIRNNYRILSARGGKVLPVIKSDAYGHGMVEIAGVLADEGADGFCIGTVDEGAELRATGFVGRIVSMLGPLEPADYPLLREFSIIPLVGEYGQLRAIAELSGTGEPLEICLKFDTGMSRLGFSPDDLDRLYDEISGLPQIRPVMACSHLATADMPERKDYVERQANIFDGVREFFRKKGMLLEAGLANSAGLLGHDMVHHDFQRPGIALYGVNPFLGTEMEDMGADLEPVMSVSAPIVRILTLEPGTCVSYGCTFRAEQRMRVAVVAAGYADCYSRGLSNTGQMNIGGYRADILGRVCMQMTCVDVTGMDENKLPEPGRRVHLLGGPEPGTISPHELASWWGTITYEVFCLLGMNPREYVGKGV